ncbi:MAG: alpha/beta hydrolase [Kosmotoga sp.]|nr:MAG: alpha/beta hydrolase [Kosmotoga sp.]
MIKFAFWIVIIIGLSVALISLVVLLQPMLMLANGEDFPPPTPIDVSVLEREIEMSNHFSPLYASQEEVVQSMIDIGEEATSLNYRGYFVVKGIEYAMLETNGEKLITRVGDSIDHYLVYGITEFAVLLNDTRNNKFIVAESLDED